MVEKLDRSLLWLSVAGFLLMSVSILLMPIQSIALLPGILFWSGLLIGSVPQLVLNTRRKRFYSRYGMKAKNMQKPRCGLLDFATNTLAKVADIAMLAGVLTLIIGWIATAGYGYICYAAIALTLFSFCMHCIFNGRNYFHVKNHRKLRRMLEQKKVNSTEKGEGENENK